VTRLLLLSLIALCWQQPLAAAGAGAKDLGTIVAATCKIENPGSTATGILIRNENGHLFVLSAAHVFEKASGNDARLILRDERTRREVSIQLRKNHKQKWVKHPTADVAVLPVNIEHCSAISMADLASPSTITIGEDAWVPGFPAQLEADESGAPVVRRGAVASVPLSPAAKHPTFLLSCATANGDSGAPVVTRSGGVIGLVVGLHRETTTTTSPTEERTVHRPLDVAIAVHAGILRETLALVD
jgi:hypothetical protein